MFWNKIKNGNGECGNLFWTFGNTTNLEAACAMLIVVNLGQGADSFNQ